jgi:hypothetical protein
MKFGESHPTFWRNTSPPFSGSKSKPSMKQAESKGELVIASAWYLLCADVLLGLLFDPEDGGGLFLQSID